jgi:hypothetical protein
LLIRALNKTVVQQKAAPALERWFLFYRRIPHYGVTVNISGPVAVPPAVVITMFPVFAPVGTIAVTCVFEFLVTVVAFTPPNV